MFELQQANSKLRDSLAAAIEARDLAIQREKKWQRTEFKDLLAAGPVCGLSVYPTDRGIQGSCGIGVMVNAAAIWRILR